MPATPGVLYVKMQPRPTLPTAQFHDWYNNEHGPGRLRLDFCQNGFRYRATDLEGQSGSEENPEWMAIYDIDDMEWLTKPIYTTLRAAPVQSQRERDTMKQIKVDRRFYDLIYEKKSKDFPVLEDMKHHGEGNVLVAVSVTMQNGKKDNDEFEKWYKEEHLPLIQKVPGWRRTRLCTTSYLEPEQEKGYIALHDYAPENGVGGKEFQAALATEWTKTVQGKMKSRALRSYKLAYTFGPAQRDLASLTDSATMPAESTNGLTRTFPKGSGKWPAIESFITTPDGLQIPYRLEGSADPEAPALVLLNCILATYGLWDGFVDAFLTANPNYRVIRFNSRGRSALPESAIKDVTVDLLAKDVITVLDALRIPRASVVGVSLGGATALNTGLKYPSRIESFVACDTNSLAPPGNPKAWGERIDMAEKEALASSSGEVIVGEELAEITVRRWFVKESYDSPEIQPKIERVKEMVKSNSLSGFKDGVKALYQYDFRDEMKNFSGKGAFLVGGGDGILPKTMKDMADGLGNGAELKIINFAGHLPMVEKPQEVADFVSVFLKK